jgi:CubicO group peptidase (beta-lactamase class C family)
MNYVAPGFEPVQAAFEANLSSGLDLGAGFCAILDCEVVVDLVGGFADRAQTRPWTHQTLVPVYSTTKPIAAMVLARLADQGKLDFDDPVAWLWPEFAAHGKDVSIAEALSHQAGVPGFVDPIDPALWLDPPKLAERLAEQAPMWTPGTASGYHPLTYGYIAGELAARAGGRTLGTQLREDICAPLGIDFWIGTPASEHDRCAEMSRPCDMPRLGAVSPEKRVAFLTKWAAPDRGGPAWRMAEIPSANGHGTARSVATLYGMFANQGRIGGQEIISPETMADLTKSRISGPDLVLPFVCDWAAGVMRNTQLVYGPNPSTMGHSGWGGSCGLGDPDRHLSAAYVMNRQSNALQGDERAQSLIAALYGCLV